MRVIIAILWMDCFAFNATGVQGDVVQQNPLDNCSEYENDTNYTIRCFTFTLSYADAFGNAGGFLALQKVSLSIQISIWTGIKYSKLKHTAFFLVIFCSIPIAVISFVPFLQTRLLI